MTRWLSLLLFVGCNEPVDSFSPPTDDQVVKTFQDLHRNAYEAYSVGLERDELHQLLASSFGGRALTQEYVEHYVTAVRMDREETAIDILRVEYEHIEIVSWEESLVTIHAEWSVGGVVTHRGHKHPRVNRYRAGFELAWSEEARIVDTQLLSLERVRSAIASGDDWVGDRVQGNGFLDAADLLMSGVEVDDGVEQWSLEEQESTEALP
jgi:hypothetical protein